MSNVSTFHECAVSERLTNNSKYININHLYFRQSGHNDKFSSSVILYLKFVCSLKCICAQAKLSEIMVGQG